MSEVKPFEQNTSIPAGRRPEVVILGLGFGGLNAAHELAGKPVNVKVVDRNNYHTFYPLLYQVGAAELEPEGIAYPARHIFRGASNVQFVMAEVEQIDLQNRVVQTSRQPLPYDYLIVSLGTRPNFYNTPGAEANSFTLKTVDQGVALRNHILYCFEQAAGEADPHCCQQWLTFTIIGGGPTGVEFAGALAELIRGSIHRDYPNLDITRTRVLLLEAAGGLLLGFPERLRGYAQQRLERMGVEVRLNVPVVEITPEAVQLKDGTRIPTRTAIWTAGMQGVPGVNQWGLPTIRTGQVDVLPTLQVPDYPEVYVVGDLAAFQQDGQPLPQVAQVAMQGGRQAGRNILRQQAGQSPRAFRYQDKGMLAVIGRNAAVAQVWGRSFTGFLAWVLWLGVHILYLIGFRNRLLVLINWAWKYFFAEHGVRLIMPAGLRQPRRMEDEAAARVQPPGAPSTADGADDIRTNITKASVTKSPQTINER